MPKEKLQKKNNQSAGKNENKDEGNSKLFSITELAHELNISTRTIRFYETKGLISPDRVAGNRVFKNRDRGRLLLILRGKRLGFSLKDVSEYLALYDSDRTQTSQVKLLYSLIDERLEKLDGQLSDIKTTISELENMRRQAKERLSEDMPSKE